MELERLTADREVLEQYRHDYSVCGKCKICHACHVQEVHHERFWRNCPSGTRYGFEAYYASGKMEIAAALVNNEIEPTPAAVHALYSCMLCGSCEEQCYGVKQLYPLRVIELLRERAVRDGWGPPEEYESLVENISKKGNLLGLPQKVKADWAKRLDLKDAADQEVDTLLFVGCQFATRPELRREIISIAGILKRCGANFGLLGGDEPCCGGPLLETGERGEFERQAILTAEKIRESRVERIVTGCAHCAYVLKEEYGSLLDDLEVLHLVEYIAPMLESNTIEPAPVKEKGVTYHDPCMIGRRLEIYEEPRTVIRSIPGMEIIEMQRAKNNALCCGGGGMAWWGFPGYASWVARERLFEADFIGASVIATACPQCQWMLGSNAVKKYGHLEVKGIWQILAESLGMETATAR